MTLGKKLKKARLDASLTQQEVAEKVGVTQCMYSYYENDFKKPTLAVAGRLAKVLNVSVDYLANDEK